MELHMAKGFLKKFETLQCPFTQTIDPSYLQELLLVPSQHRLRLLSWLLSCIDLEIEQIIEKYHNNHPAFASSLEVNGEIQLLTEIASTLGLCLPTDMDLIRGKVSEHKHVALWKNLLSIATNISEQGPDVLRKQTEDTTNILEAMLSTCDMSAILSTSLKLLPPALSSELNMTLNTKKSSSFSQSSMKLMDPEEKESKLKELTTELEHQHSVLKELQKNCPYFKREEEDQSLLNKLERSLELAMSDLDQLQITYLQAHDNFFRPYCDKSPIQFSQIGPTIRNIDKELTSFLELMRNAKTMMTKHRQITESD